MTAKREMPGPIVPSPANTLDIAVSLARIGWPVFPVGIYEDATGKRHKIPGVKWKDWASTDEAAVRLAWSTKFRDFHIGVYAEKAGIVVLDLDPGHEAAVEREGVTIPKTFHYPTQRAGGAHHIYAAPEGLDLTIDKNIVGPSGDRMEGVDVRAGSGLMVYYGPELTEHPALTFAPDWLVMAASRKAPRHNNGVDSAPGATEEAFRARLRDDKPKKKLATLIRDYDFPAGGAHDAMLEVVAALISEGAKGTPGVKALLDETRARYVEGGADRARDWDNAVEGSVRRFGLPPLTFSLSRTQQKAIKKRNRPEAVEAAKAERKATFRVEKHIAAMNLTATGERPIPGERVLEDSSLAPELASVLSDRWAYATGLGIMRYDGRVWKPAEEHALIEAVRRELVDMEVEEHNAAAFRGDNKALEKARSLLSRSRAKAVALLVVGILGERAPIFDAHADLLNTPTGVVDLRTSQILPHDPGYFFTKITGIGYDPNADMTLWSRALAALPEEVGAWLQVRFGQMATGYTPDDDALVILEGAGSNGKTSWMIGQRKALGDYAVTLPERLLMGEPGDHPTTLMTLMGARGGFIEELPEGRALNVKRLKDTVGTPEITARKMRQDDVTFTATHGLCIATNYLPIVAETDHGTWRRLFLVRFRIRYVPRKKDIKSKRDRKGDPSLKRHFEHTPDTGLLRWIVEGAAQWYANGMRMPEAPAIVRRDTDAWRLDADPILAYVGERIVRDERFGITSTDLVADFNLWLEKRGHRPWSNQTINSRFQGHTSLDGVERRNVKWSASMAPSRSRAVFTSQPVPRVTTAWRGIRFADEPSRMPSEAERDAATIAELERAVR